MRKVIIYLIVFILVTFSVPVKAQSLHAPLMKRVDKSPATWHGGKKKITTYKQRLKRCAKLTRIRKKFYCHLY